MVKQNQSENQKDKGFYIRADENKSSAGQAQQGTKTAKSKKTGQNRQGSQPGKAKKSESRFSADEDESSTQPSIGNEYTTQQDLDDQR